MKLSIIIVSHNVRNLLANCLRTVRDTCNGIEHEVIVVDNASSDGSMKMVRELHPTVRLIENNTNDGFAAANNQAFMASEGEFVLLLNPDTEVGDGVIPGMIEFMGRSGDAGLAACRLLNSDGTIQKSIMNLPSVTEYLSRVIFIDRLLFPRHKARTYYRDRPFVIGMPSGAFMMVRRAAVGGDRLFEDVGFLYAEEPDLCLRLWKKGWKVYFVPQYEIVHHQAKSTKGMMFKEMNRGMKRLFNKHWFGFHRFMIHGAYWLSLLTSTIVSCIGIYNDKGRRRFTYLLLSMLTYPWISAGTRGSNNDSNL